MGRDSTRHASRSDSWKSIAQFLNYSVRTVQRWHVEYGLPVRHLAGDKSSVFAFPEELDEWMRRRGDILPHEPFQLSPAATLPPSRVGDHREAADQSNTASGPARLLSSDLVDRAAKTWEILTPSNIEAIARVYREAIELDPNNAHAFAGLALALVTNAMMNGMGALNPYEGAKAALSRAIEIDPEIIEVSWAPAWLKMMLERDWEGARRLFDESLNQSRLFASALIGRSLLFIVAGQLQNATECLLEVLNLNPLNTPVAALTSWSVYLSGECEWALDLDLIERARGSGHSGRILDAVETLSLIQSDRSDAYFERIQSLAAESPYHYTARCTRIQLRHIRPS